MKIIPTLTFLALTFCTAFLDTAGAQPLTITTIAGQYRYTSSNDGVGTNAHFYSPEEICADQAGNLYVIDTHAVRKISPNLTVTTFAGKPYISGYNDATGTNALFNFPDGIAVDTNGYIYVADSGNLVVRKISPAGVVTTLAGNGTSGYLDATGTNAEFSNLNGIAVDSSGNVYVSDLYYGTYSYQGRNRIRKITADGVVSTLAGGSEGYNDGVGAAAQFDYPQGLAVDSAGTVYVADSFGIRKVAPDGTVTTWAGSQNNNGTELDGIGANAGFYEARAIALDRAGGAYVVDENGETIRYIYSPAGVVSTVAGLANQSPTNNSNDGVGSDARFLSPYGIAVDTAGNVFITDISGATVLKGGPPPLAIVGSFSESPGVSPVRSNNPWQFTAYYTNIVSDLRLRVQSTTTTNIEASWTDLPGNLSMTDVGGNWNLNTTDIPTGTRYFRVVASAPGYFDSASAAVGPEDVLDGLAPFGNFSWETTSPYENDTPWIFNIIQPSVAPGLALQVQSSEDLTNWSDLHGGGQMSNSASGTWVLTTTNAPFGGTQYFRVVASATNYVDQISAVLGPFNIIGLLPGVIKTYTNSGSIGMVGILEDMQLENLELAELLAGTNNLLLAFSGNNEQFDSEVTLAGQAYLSTLLTFDGGQTIGLRALNVTTGGAVVLKGVINGDVALVSTNVIDPDLASFIGQNNSDADGGTLTFDTGSAWIVKQNATNSLTQSNESLLSGIFGGSSSPSVVKQALSAIEQKSNGPFKPADQPTQPSYTGQMTVNGNYSQFSGTLIIAVAGTNTLSGGAQQFDQLLVSGTANLLGGTIAFGLFNPDDQTNQDNVFQPPDGATFDVVVASNIVVNAVSFIGPIWGDGQFFTGSVVTRDDGLQAVRLTAIHVPPRVGLMNAGSNMELFYATNYTGYAVESSTNLSDWSAFSTGTNVVVLSPTNTSQFFRLSKP